MLGSAESEDHNLTICVIVFEQTQTIWPQYLNVTDRMGDLHGNTALCIASRSNKIIIEQIYETFSDNLLV